MANGREKYLYPVTVPSDARSIVVTHEGVDHTVSVAARDWYVHAETASGSYPGLLIALSTALSAATGSTYVFLPATPSKSPSQVWSGLVLANIASASWSLKFSDPGFTLDPRLLGFSGGQSEDVVASSGTHKLLATSVTLVRSDFTYLGAWRSWTRLASCRGALEKMSRPVAERAVSSSRASNRRVLTWYDERVRSMKYSWVPGAHVRQGMASKPSWAMAGQLGLRDMHNQFEDLWQALAAGKVCRLVHYERDEPLDLFYSSGGEAVALRGDDAMSDFGNVATRMPKAGDCYSLSFELTVVAGNYIG